MLVQLLVARRTSVSDQLLVVFLTIFFFCYQHINISSCTVISAAQHEVNEALLASLQTAADALEGSDAAVGKDYIATAKKVLSKGGAAYVSKELKRLDGIIAGKSILPEKKSAFQLRRNLLAAFQAPAL